MYSPQIMRKMISLFIIVLLFASVSSAQSAEYTLISKNNQTYYIYKVKSGEGLYAVSRLFNVSVDELMKSNPGTESGLKHGQELLVPAAKSNKVLQDGNQSKTFRHTVERGMTLYSIAQMYNTTVEDIIRLNPGLTENLSEGQVLVIPQQKKLFTSDEGFTYHTIIAKETLYSVSKLYKLKPENLIEANSGLSVETFQVGKIIRIPNKQVAPEMVMQVKNEVHRVKKGETMFSISQLYGVKVSDIEEANGILASKIKPNMELVVPVKNMVEVNNRMSEVDADRLLSKVQPNVKADVLKVGLLLPFLDTKENQHLRLQEYYEGFLLAVDKMKSNGANIEVYVFDISTKTKLESLLGTMEMQSLHLLIGGMTDEQISILSNFSQKNKVKYVVPFSSKNNEVLSNDKIFQVNTPHMYLYAKASGMFVNQFRTMNVVIVDVPDNDDKADFITILKSDLKKNNIKYQSVRLSDDLATDILPMLRNDVENIIVPTSGNSGSLKDIMNSLSEVLQTNVGMTTRLFGYPEWQTYGYDMQKLMHSFGTYFYSSFYVDNQDAKTRQFLQDFKKWYGRDLIVTFPKYGMFGYDTGLFFLNAMHKYGINFENHVEQVSVDDLVLQFAFKFERANNWGGFINTGLFLIHYDTDNQTYKINKSR